MKREQNWKEVAFDEEVLQFVYSERKVWNPVFKGLTGNVFFL